MIQRMPVTQSRVTSKIFILPQRCKYLDIVRIIKLQVKEQNISEKDTKQIFRVSSHKININII